MIANKTYFALSLSLAALAFAPRARAGDAAAAEALFNEARRLMAEGNYTAACPQLEESQKQDPGMGTLYNLGDCYEKSGRIASAWAAFLDVAAQAKSAGQAARETDARARAAAIEPKLSRLTIAVASAVPDMAVKRDAVAVGKAQFGLALPVDPGEHLIEVSAPGKKPWSGKVQVAANGANARIEVPALENAPVPVAITSPQSERVDGDASSSGAGKTQRTIGIVVGAAGIVGMGVGGFFGVRSMSKKSAADGDCTNGLCNENGMAERHSAITAGNLSTVFFIAGGAVTAGGLALFLTAPKDHSRTAKATLSPVAMPSGGGLMLKGSL